MFADIVGFMMAGTSSQGKYSQSIVTFIDILGFSNLIAERPAAEIHNILDIVSQRIASPELAAAGYGGGEEPKSVTTFSFSDSILRVRQLTKGHRKGALRGELYSLAFAQWLLVREGILVRGGMTIGDISLAEGRAFGPGFIRAYELESKFANMPRIIIDPGLIHEIRYNKKVRGWKRSLYQEMSSIRQCVSMGDDGIFFLNYLSLVSERMIDALDSVEVLVLNKTVVVNLAKRVQPTSPLFQKYMWLVRYHNLVVRGFGKEFDYLTIKRRDVPAFDNLYVQRAL